MVHDSTPPLGVEPLRCNIDRVSQQMSQQIVGSITHHNGEHSTFQKCTQLIALDSQRPPALIPIPYKLQRFPLMVDIIAIIAFIDHDTPDYISQHFVVNIFIWVL